MEDRSLGVGRRDYKDRRPGTPIPFHEPHPDRHAISDAIRAKLEREQTERRLRAAIADQRNAHAKERARIDAETRALKRSVVRRETLTQREMARVIDVFPNEPEPCLRAEAELCGRRGNRVVYFRSAATAADALVEHTDATDIGARLTVVVRYTTILRSALRRGDGACEAFGWKWERLVRRRKAKR